MAPGPATQLHTSPVSSAGTATCFAYGDLITPPSMGGTLTSLRGSTYLLAQPCGNSTGRTPGAASFPVPTAWPWSLRLGELGLGAHGSGGEGPELMMGKMGEDRL